MHEIQVNIVSRNNRPHFYMRYKDPVTGKQPERSTGKSNRREAEKVAAKWEAELQEGRYKATSKITVGVNVTT